MPHEQIEVIDVQCGDEGFTGGVTGVLRPRSQLFPARWRDALGPDATNLAVRRRLLAVKSGSWQRGRLAALSFTAIGLLFASLLVETTQVGTALGTIQFSLWFSLWSFLGLLTLPTFSRRGVIEIDDLVRAEGFSTTWIRSTAERLDRLQDGETKRSSIVETILHPTD